MAKQANPEPKKTEPVDLIGSLRTLHTEHCRSLHELIDEQEKSIENALQACLTELASIEAEVDTATRKSTETFETTDRDATVRGFATPHYWDHQKRLSEASVSARDRAEAARKTYLDAWKAAEEGHRNAIDKARRDYLARVQDAWKNVSIADLDQSTTAELIRGFDAILTAQSGRG